MRKLFYAIGAAICLATSNVASAACAHQNVYNSGMNVPLGGSAIVYAPINTSCTYGVMTFKFEDLSGNYPTNTIRHFIERSERSYTGAYYWKTVYQKTTYSVRDVTIMYPVSIPGSYRYRVENIGNSVIRNWYMEGKVPLFNIPSYY